MGRSDLAKRGTAIAFAAAIALTLPCFGTGRAQARTTVGFWAGEAVLGSNGEHPGTYWNRRDTRPYTPKLWSVLSRNRIPLYFNLRYRRDFGPVPPGKPHRTDGLEIVREANRLGVPVWGWVLIPYSEGYWAWEGVGAEELRAVKALRLWSQRNGVRLRGMVLDPEPPIDTPFDSKAAILGGGVDSVFSSLLPQTIDPARQCSAWNRYRHISKWARRHHVALSAAPAAVALDDLEDGSLALQDASEFVVPKAHWHELFFQVYRSAFAYYGGRKPGSGLVSSYLRSARRWFGRKGQISLGAAGRPGYQHLGSLVHDVRLAATLGAREVPIYSLEKTLRSYGGTRAMLRLAQAAHHPFTGKKSARATAVSPHAEALRASIHLADTAATNATPTISEGLGAARPAESLARRLRQAQSRTRRNLEPGGYPCGYQWPWEIVPGPIWGYSSAGRAPGSHPGGRRFESA